MMEKYDDIIHLPHPDPRNHQRMSMLSRAAQFAPFAALTGYDDAIYETARHTDQQINLDEYHQQLLNDKFYQLMEHIVEQPTVTICYFEPDSKKQGGVYRSVTGIVKNVDEYNQRLIMADGHQIALMSIIDIDMHEVGLL